MKSKNNIEYDILRAFHKNEREREIDLFGKSICYVKIFRNKKKYNRKRKHKNRDY